VCVWVVNATPRPFYPGKMRGCSLGIVTALTLILLTWRIWWALNNVSKWQMGFNSAFKGLNFPVVPPPPQDFSVVYCLCHFVFFWPYVHRFGTAFGNWISFFKRCRPIQEVTCHTLHFTPPQHLEFLILQRTSRRVFEPKKQIVRFTAHTSAFFLFTKLSTCFGLRNHQQVWWWPLRPQHVVVFINKIM